MLLILSDGRAVTDLTGINCNLILVNTINKARVLSRTESEKLKEFRKRKKSKTNKRNVQYSES